jgi:hypothetical protein
MALHILEDLQNVVGWWIVVNYMQTSPTRYYLDTTVVGEQPTWNSPLTNLKGEFPCRPLTHQILEK